MHADDEVGQLASRFNGMLERLEASRAALDDSVRAQRQLVADASHELRTPVTSLRTNIEVLLADPNLGDEERERLLSDVVEQSEELSALVGDLIELARGDLPPGMADETRFDRIVAESLARARRNSPAISFDATLTPVIVEGIPERLGRAVNNLLDNAARHSPPNGTVEVIVDADGVRVRDHGSGVPEHELPARVRSVLPRRQYARSAGQRPRAVDRPPGGRAARGLGHGRQRARRRGDLHPPAPERADDRRRRRVRGSVYGAGGRVTRLPRGHEPLAQLPEQERVDRDRDRDQERRAVLLVRADDAEHADAEGDRRDRREQRRVGPVAGEMLTPVISSTPSVVT